MESGETLWERVFPEPVANEIAIDDANICVPPYILSQTTGELVADLSGYGYDFLSVGDVDGGAFVLITVGSAPGVLRHRGNECTHYPFKVGSVVYVDDSGLLVGFENGEYLTCFSINEGRNIWSSECSGGENNKCSAPWKNYMVFGGRVYQHINLDTLRCIDLLSGVEVWQSGADCAGMDDEELLRRAPSRFLGCDDALYLCRDIEDDGFLQARSTEDGSELWRVEAPQARAFLIAGDLLFGGLDDYPVAWDRHTGEVVWRAEKPFAPLYHAVAAGNKVVFNTTTNQMRCYEWSEPYVSTARK
jgi:outer membrane protein assembly factor BamB